MTRIELLVLILSSEFVLGIAQFLITRYFSNRDKVNKTLAAFSYHELAATCEHRIEQQYATKHHRHEIEILYEAYKENGWNGDMDDLVDKVYDLPLRPPDKQKKS